MTAQQRSPFCTLLFCNVCVAHSTNGLECELLFVNDDCCCSASSSGLSVSQQGPLLACQAQKLAVLCVHHRSSLASSPMATTKEAILPWVSLSLKEGGTKHARLRQTRACINLQQGFPKTAQCEGHRLGPHKVATSQGLADQSSVLTRCHQRRGRPGRPRQR